MGTIDTIRSETPAAYSFAAVASPEENEPGEKIFVENALIARALAILQHRLSRSDNTQLECPQDTADYCRLLFASAERELFSVLWLDTRHRMIACETIHQGGLESANVSPREVAKSGLRHNAAAAILTHNHPSGNPEPSAADAAITQRVKDALALVEIRTLDHIVVGAEGHRSMAALGLL